MREWTCGQRTSGGLHASRMCGSGRWCRALVGALLVTLGAPLELYDLPPASDDLFYQDGNDIDTGPGEDPRPLPQLNDVILRKIIQALQLQGAPDDRISYRLRPNKLPYEAERHRGPAADVKGSVYKRLAEVWGGHHLAYKNSDVRPQQKWKIKKGKAIGSQMVCYFKLCAFRSPA